MTDRIHTHFIEDIHEAISAIERFVDGMNFEQFFDDEKTIRAVERELEIIGEAVKQLPLEVTSNYSDIPWKAIAGMRDHLIHHYWHTEEEILWKTIIESIPPLKNTIISILGTDQK